jgi:GTP-binding protein HflX
MEAVDRVLSELSRQARTGILVLNKIDRVQDRIAIQLLRSRREEEVIYVSAATGEGLDDLERAVARKLDERSSLVDVYAPYDDGRLVASVLRIARPLEDEVSLEGGWRRMRLRLTNGALGSLRQGGGSVLRIDVLEKASTPSDTEPDRTAPKPSPPELPASRRLAAEG